MIMNRVSDLLGVRYPIIEGGMAYVGNGELAAAVSNAGGFGQVAVSGRNPDNFREQINIAATKTKKPFGVNIPISGYFSHYNEYFEIIKENKEHLHAVSLGSGDPRPFIPFFKELGLKVIVIVGTVKHAINAEKAGADIIVCEGFEAGGRNSPYELTLFSLVPQVIKAVNVPVVAAGGISDGSGMVAAMALGAEGVQLGTRFIATKECQAHEDYKKLLVEANDQSTTVIERSVGGANRVIKNEYVQQVAEVEKGNLTPGELYPYISGFKNKIAALEGKLDDGWVHAGQSVGLIGSIEGVEDVIQQMVHEMQETKERLQGSLDKQLL
ncbi:NAD(P)H-dependent flavin oxidoreductase [Desertibacillus haloalkaliphilus]|uniref:NAD(P)H-dependent flavin oxidoreductase n=1 Tax=Desertibacillus haloalkaliphilus TaxID=1328930 RepID=UPI001C274029|nr:nitronate monooxygenase [Desertibacillus haloalkaliphilus]MBU8908217.1 nitronate monooxygenase [Desertibacillus haloalkaliphilus]